MDRKCILLTCAVLLVIVGLVTTADNEYCTEMYRKDRLQTWSIKATSKICQPGNGFSLSNGQLWFNSTHSGNASLDSHFWSTIDRGGGEAGISLYTPHGSVKLYFKPADASLNNADTLRYDWSDGFGSSRWYTYYYKEGDFIVTGKNNTKFNNIQLYGLTVLTYVSPFFLKSAVPGVIFLGTFHLLTGVVQGTMNLTNIFLFLFMSLLVISVSAGIAYICFRKLGDSQKKYVVLGCFVVMFLWVYLDLSSWGVDFIILMFPFIIYAFFIVAALFGCLSSSDGVAKKTEGTALGCLMGVGTVVVFYVYYSAPAIPFMMIITWRRNYTNGVFLKTLDLFVYLVISFCLNIIFYFIVFCIWKRRNSKYFESSKAGDSIAFSSPTHQQPNPSAAQPISSPTHRDPTRHEDQLTPCVPTRGNQV